MTLTYNFQIFIILILGKFSCLEIEELYKKPARRNYMLFDHFSVYGSGTVDEVVLFVIKINITTVVLSPS